MNKCINPLKNRKSTAKLSFSMKNARRDDIPMLVKILTPAFSTNLSVNRCVKQDGKRLQRIDNQIENCPINRGLDKCRVM